MVLARLVSPSNYFVLVSVSVVEQTPSVAFSLVYGNQVASQARLKKIKTIANQYAKKWRYETN